MKYSFVVTMLGCLLLVSNRLAAQSEERVLWGIIKDQHTLEPVPAAHIVTPQRGAFSDSAGFFSITVAPTDTLVLSHVNYRAHTIAARTVSDTLFISLTSRDVLLREVVVHGLPTEEQFKEQLLGMNLPPSQEVMNARTNFDYAQKLYLAGYVPTMNSRDNYQWHLQEPKGITLFSSGPTKGLSKALKSLFRYNKLFTPVRTHSTQAIPNTGFTGGADSLTSHKLIRYDTSTMILRQK